MKALTIRLPDETYETLSRLALEDDRTVAKFVSRFLVVRFPDKGSPNYKKWVAEHGVPPPVSWGDRLSPEADRGSDLDDPATLPDGRPARDIVGYLHTLANNPPPSGTSGIDLAPMFDGDGKLIARGEIVEPNEKS